MTGNMTTERQENAALVMRSRPASRWLVPAVLCCALWLPACASPPAPRPASPAQPQPCSFTYNNAVARLKQWALGCDAVRQAAPPSGSATLIWYTASTHNAGVALGKRIRRVCMNQGTSLLTAPGDRVYLVKAGLLYTLDPYGRSATLVQTQVPGWRFSHLLGFARRPGALQILAVMTTQTAGGEIEEGLWLFTVNGTTASGAPFADIDALTNPVVLMQRFVLPRCASGYDQCLVIQRSSSSAATLGHAPARGASINGVPGAGTLNTIDAVWAAPGDTSQMLLVVAGSCPGRIGAHP